MNPVAKFTIIIPIVIILAAIAMHSQERPKQLVPPIIRPAQPNQDQKKFDPLALMGKSTQKLNLNGPFACSYSHTGTSLRAFIKNKQIYSKYVDPDRTSYILAKEDCLYMWEENAVRGRQMCGIGQYLTMAEKFSELPFFSPEMIAPLIKKFQPDIKLKSEDLTSVMKSCEKTQIDDVLFTIPSKITFTEEKLLQSTSN